jgi:hypothetical protein
MTTRRNMRYLIMAGKYINNIRTLARQPPIPTIEGLLEAVFSVGFNPRPYSEDPRPAESSSVEWSEMKRSEVK